MPPRPIRLQRRTAAAIAALVIALLTAAGVIQLDDTPTPPPEPAPVPRTLELGGPGHATIPAAAPTPAAPLERTLHDDTAAQGAAQLAAAAHNAKLRPAGQPRVPAYVPLAAPTVPGCKTALVRNFSSRGGAPILLGVIHWTGSPVTPGWAGIDGNLKWFDTLAASASSNEITDSWGNCALAVPETAKAWTQAAFNPWALSVEIVNPGALPLFHDQAGFDRVVSLLIGWHQRWNLPLQPGRVSCPGGRPTVLRAGILAHRDLGPCGGGHPDVGDYPVQTLIDAALARTAWKPTATDRRTCQRLNTWRHAGRPHAQLATNIRRRDALTRRGVRCTSAGPVHRT